MRPNSGGSSIMDRLGDGTSAFLLSGLSLLLALGWCLQPGGVSAKAPAGEAALKTAARRYQQHCAKCHGKDYTGKPWRESNGRIPNFTSRAWQKSRSDVQLQVSILEGKGTHMPAFSEKLNKETARALIRLIRKAAP